MIVKVPYKTIKTDAGTHYACRPELVYDSITGNLLS